MPGSSARVRNRTHPLDEGGFRSTACWRWLTPFLWYNYFHRNKDNPLLLDDIWEVPRDTACKPLAQQFHALWNTDGRISLNVCKTLDLKGTENARCGWRGGANSSVPYGKGRLLRIMIRLYFWRWMKAGSCYILWCTCALGQPEIIALTVSHITSSPNRDRDTVSATTIWHGLGYALLLMICGLGYAWSINATFTILCRFGTQIKATMQSILFDKALRLHVSSQNADIGAWTNLVANDTDAIFQCIKFLHYPLLSTTFVCIVLGMMIRTVGVVPAVCGFGILLLVLPLNGFASTRIGSYKRKMISRTDERTDLVSQVLEGMEVIKSWSLEPAFANRITAQRNEELKHVTSIHILDAFLKVILFSVPSLVAVFTIFLAHYMEQPLSLVVVLKMLSYLNILRFPLLIIPLSLGNIFQALVSLKRMEEFLMLPEAPRRIQHDGSTETNSNDTDFDLILKVNDANFKWQPQNISEDQTSSTGKLSAGNDMPKNSSQKHFELCNVNLSVPRGSLCGLVGTVGGGKSLFCHGILRELDGSVGTVQVHTTCGSIAFASQSPQILNQTLRDNIIFGRSFDEERFHKCIFASCLDVDTRGMANGTNTVLGERGINLSGGQKARVAFARTLYAATSDPENSLALLDDPLSAVDNQVGSEMWRRGVLGLLRESGVTTIIILSSRVEEFLEKDADIIYELVPADTNVEKSKGKETSEYNQKLSNRMTIKVLINRTLTDSNCQKPTISMASDSGYADQDLDVEEVGGLVEAVSEPTDTEILSCKSSVEGKNQSEPTSIILKEKRDVGRLRCSVWTTFLGLICLNRNQLKRTLENSGETYGGDSDRRDVRSDSVKDDGGTVCCCKRQVPYNIGLATSSGYALGYILIFVYLTAQGVKTLLDLSLVWFGGKEQGAPSWMTSLSWSQNQWTVAFFLGVLAVFLVSLGRSIFAIFLLIQSSRNMHTLVLNKVLHAPLLYFQRRPSGRILNKFSADMLKVDLVLPMLGCSLIENISSLANAMVLSVISVPYLILVLIPALLLLMMVVNMFRASSREVGRLDSEAKSPIYSAFSNVLRSRTTIRAFQGSVSFMLKNAQHAIDRSSSVFLVSVLMVRWNSFRLNTIMTIYSTSLFAAAVILKESSSVPFSLEMSMNLTNSTNPSSSPDFAYLDEKDGDWSDPAIIGLALVYSLQLLGLSSFTAISFIGTESALTSVERIFQFLDMPQEKAQLKPERDPPLASDSNSKTWPSAGELTIKSLRLRYRADLPLVLNGLDLKVKAGEKLGVVGRTGAGKSSIFVSLLRLTEPEPGTVMELDDQDLLSLGLHRIRHGAITIIPQTPVVFSGSIRFNIDPYGLCTDEEIWKILEDMSPSLSKVVKERQGGLASPCGRNGSLFSHGQRQIIVVARALLLKGTAVFLLDEATSSLDDHSDHEVEQAIEKYGRGATIIKVAHRISTVMSCDRIAVVDAGKIVELDTPSVLKKSGGIFSQMCQNLTT